MAESRPVGIDRPLERRNGGGGGDCVQTPCKKTGEDRSPPGATDGHCTLGRSAMPLGSGPVTPSIRDGSAFGWRCQWRGGTNRPGVTTAAISLAPPAYGLPQQRCSCLRDQRRPQPQDPDDRQRDRFIGLGCHSDTSLHFERIARWVVHPSHPRRS